MYCEKLWAIKHCFIRGMPGYYNRHRVSSMGVVVITSPDAVCTVWAIKHCFIRCMPGYYKRHRVSSIGVVVITSPDAVTETV